MDGLLMLGDHRSVYCELADQYKDMDPVSDVARRNLLAKHLKEVVDILEEKVPSWLLVPRTCTTYTLFAGRPNCLAIGSPLIQGQESEVMHNPPSCPFGLSLSCISKH